MRQSADGERQGAGIHQAEGAVVRQDAYEIYKGGEHWATIEKELFTFFNCTFDVHVDPAGDLEAQGDLSDHEYTFTRDGTPVAQISKLWFAMGDTYGVDIAEGEDALLILASTVVIDLACHER